MTDYDIDKIGLMMGDPNFDAYFNSSQRGPVVFIEDIRPLTKKALEEAGVAITKALDGSSAMRKHVDVLRSVPGLVPKKAFFLLDNDKGAKDFAAYLVPQALKGRQEEFTLYAVGNEVFIILFPKGFTAEDLFDEFDDEVEECAKAIYEADYTLRANAPMNLTRAASAARARGKLANMDEAKSLIRNQQDVKDRFWARLSTNQYKISVTHANCIKKLLYEA